MGDEEIMRDRMAHPTHGTLTPGWGGVLRPATGFLFGDLNAQDVVYADR
jgi:hypothetical protein